MTKVSKTSAVAAPDSDRKNRLGHFFRAARQAEGLTLEQVASALELDSTATIDGYESGTLSMPLEDVFALTNLLNVAPEDVMDLVHSLYLLGAH